MRDVIVEKGVPVPSEYDDSRGGRGRSRYPLRSMEVGDSFVVEVEEKEQVRRAVANFNHTKKEWHFIIRTREEGVRVWRSR